MPLYTYCGSYKLPIESSQCKRFHNLRCNRRSCIGLFKTTIQLSPIYHFAVHTCLQVQSLHKWTLSPTPFYKPKYNILYLSRTVGNNSILQNRHSTAKSLVVTGCTISEHPLHELKDICRQQTHKHGISSSLILAAQNTRCWSPNQWDTVYLDNFLQGSSDLSYWGIEGTMWNCLSECLTGCCYSIGKTDCISLISPFAYHTCKTRVLTIEIRGPKWKHGKCNFLFSKHTCRENNRAVMSNAVEICLRGWVLTALRAYKSRDTYHAGVQNLLDNVHIVNCPGMYLSCQGTRHSHISMGHIML